MSNIEVDLLLSLFYDAISMSVFVSGEAESLNAD
jgi:hypothetical protein